MTTFGSVLAPLAVAASAACSLWCLVDAVRSRRRAMEREKEEEARLWRREQEEVHLRRRLEVRRRILEQRRELMREQRKLEEELLVLRQEVAAYAMLERNAPAAAQMHRLLKGGRALQVYKGGKTRG